MSHDAKSDSKLQSRREFLKAAGIGAALAVPAANALSGQLLGAPEARAQAAPVLVKETDPNAVALGYKEDATKVDVKKYTKRAGADGKTQFCNNCQFYQAKTKDPKTEPVAVCTLFAGKAVKGTGWCNSWAKRA